MTLRILRAIRPVRPLIGVRLVPPTSGEARLERALHLL